MEIPGVYTPEQIRELELRGACPYWMRVNPRGWCVNRWWAGGAVARIVDGLAVVTGMALIGFIIAEAGKFRSLKPALDTFKSSREQARFLMNAPRRRRARRRRRRRR